MREIFSNIVKLSLVFDFDGIFFPAGVEFEFEENALLIKSEVSVAAKTGVEMEALTAAATAALTVYDMAKAMDRTMVITDLRLDSKSGGRSGVYKRADKK